MFKIVGNSVKFNMWVSQGQRWKKSSKGIRLVTSICLLVRPENRWRTICRPLPSSPVLRFSCWAPYRFIFPQEKLAFFYCFTFSAEDLEKIWKTSGIAASWIDHGWKPMEEKHVKITTDKGGADIKSEKETVYRGYNQFIRFVRIIGTSLLIGQ